MLTVTALARRCDTTPHTVRYYSRMGLLRSQRHPQNQYRLYPFKEVSRLNFIRQAKYLGYTLNEIRQILQDAENGESPCPQVREILQRHIKENRARLDELLTLQNRMEQALQQWSRMQDGVPNGHSVCHLIETFTDEPDQEQDDGGLLR